MLCLLTYKDNLQQSTCLLRTKFWLTSCFLQTYILRKYIFGCIDPIWTSHALCLCCVFSPIKITCNKAPVCWEIIFVRPPAFCFFTSFVLLLLLFFLFILKQKIWEAIIGRTTNVRSRLFVVKAEILKDSKSRNSQESSQSRVPIFIFVFLSFSPPNNREIRCTLSKQSKSSQKVHNVR